jgi:hypothetical protein
MSKKPPDPMIGKTQGISQQQQNAGAGNIASGVGMENQAVTNPTSSPLYKALYSTEAGQMSNAYGNAQANTAAKARQAGFGYQQPAAQGAQAELGGREASALGQLPGEVAAQTVPMELQAGNQIAQAGLGQEGQGNQLFTQGVEPLEQQYQQYSLNYVPMWQRLLGGAIGKIPGMGGIGGAIGSTGSSVGG